MPSSDCLLVHRDGTTSRQYLPVNAEEILVYSVPTREPFKATIGDSPCYHRMKIQDYIRQGRLFGQQWIYCAKGWVAKEFYQERLIADSTTEYALMGLRADLRSTTWKQMEQECRQWVFLGDRNRNRYRPGQTIDHLKLYQYRLVVATVED